MFIQTRKILKVKRVCCCITKIVARYDLMCHRLSRKHHVAFAENISSDVELMQMLIR